MRRATQAIPLAAYVAISFAYFGWPLLPHPGRVVFGSAGNAPIYIWSFAWWPHAIGSWTNPFVSHALYAPIGVNIAWTPSAPGLALAFSPLTVLVGPIVSYNVAGILLPALSAWTGYLLCRYLTRSTWASLVGGYLFGFSTANLRQISPGNVNLSAVFLFPLVALVVLKYLRRELSGRGLAWRLGALLAFQLTISTEFATVVTLALAASLLLAFWLVRDLRPRLRAAVAPIAAGYALAAVFVAPFTYYLLFHFESGSVAMDIKLWGTDVLAAFVPNFTIGLGGNELLGLQRHVSSRLAYLGLPTVAILVLYAIRARRAPGGRFALAAFAAAFVATLGAAFEVAGNQWFTLPWWTAASHVPALNNVLPFRFGILESLAASVIVALWTAGTKGRVFKRPYILPALAVAALVPLVWHPSAFTPRNPERLAFFTRGIYKCIAPGETIVIYPGADDALIWQAETGFRFNLAQGGLQPFRQAENTLNRFDDDPVVRDLAFAGPYRPSIDRLLAFAGVHGVDRVVSIEKDRYPTLRQMARFGPPAAAGGAIVAPACGRPSLARRNLARFVRVWEVDPPPLSTHRNLAWCLNLTYTEIPLGLIPAASPTNTLARYVKGQGLTCSAPPAGYARHGLASATLGVPGGTYPYYSN